MINELSPIERAQLKRKEMQEQGIALNRDPNQKFIDHPRPMRAIRRFCWECNGYSLGEATKCQNKDCALWLFRLGKSNPREEELPHWRIAYSKHLKLVGEYGKSSESDPEDNENSDDPIEDDGEE